MIRSQKGKGCDERFTVKVMKKVLFEESIKLEILLLWLPKEMVLEFSNKLYGAKLIGIIEIALLICGF